MKKRNKFIIVRILLIIEMMLFFSKITSNAVIVSTDKEVKSGETVSISVSSKQVLGSYTVQLVSNGGLTLKSASGGEVSQDSKTVTGSSSSGTKSLATYTFIAPSVTADTKYNVQFKISGMETPNLQSIADESNTAVITVKASSTASINNNNSNNNSNNNNNNNNNSDNNNNGETTQEKEPTFKSASDTVYATGDINIRKSYSTDSDILGKLATGDSISRTGIGDNGWSKVSYNGETGYIKTSLLTTEEPEKSSDKSLKTLVITPEGLNPEFDPEVTTYTLNVDKDVEKLDIKAAPNDENAKVEITGNENLQVGDNIVKITVTAQDETTRIYTINVKKDENATLGLSSLSVDGYTLSPNFSSSKYEYNLNVFDPSITKLNVIAEANDENAQVEITGNTDIKDGNNVIQIIVTSEDGTEKVIYTITVNKSSMVAGTTKNNDSSNIIYIGIIVAILAIFLVAVIIIKKRKKSTYIEDNNSDQEDYEDLYGYSTKKATTSYRNNDDMINANNIVDHELFGELPNENYNQSASNIYSKIADNNALGQDLFEASFKQNYDVNENQNQYKDVYNTIGDMPNDNTVYGKTIPIYENNVNATPYNDVYGNNGNIGYSFDNIEKNNEISYNNSFENSNNINENNNIYGNNSNIYENNNDIYGNKNNLYGNYESNLNYNEYKTNNVNNTYDDLYGTTNSNFESNNNNLYNYQGNNAVQDNYDLTSNYNSTSTTSQYQEQSLSTIEDNDEEEYTLDDNYKMKRTKGKHSK